MASVIKIIASIFILLIGFPIFIGGSAILLFVPLFTDSNGYFMTTPILISSDEYPSSFSAIRVDIPLDDVQIGVRIDPSQFIKFKMKVHGETPSEKVFLGLCSMSDADSFLGSGTAYLLIRNFDYYSGFEFGDVSEEPAYRMDDEIISNTTNWVQPSDDGVSWLAGGNNDNTFKWDPSYKALTGDSLSLVLMNTNMGATYDVNITFSIGAKIPIINAIGWVLVIFGGLFSLLGIILLWSGLRTKKPRARERVRYYQGAPTTRVEAVAKPTPEFHLQCSNCGSLNEPDSAFCSRCGEVLLSEDRKTVEKTVEKTDMDILEPTGYRLSVAEGWPRFWAWLIDIMIVGAITSTLSSIIFFSIGDWSWWSYGIFDPFQWLFSLGPTSIVFFFYCIIMEHYYGQTLGKMALNLEIVSEITGDQPILQNIVISALGKAFFLPIDVILGIITKDESQIPDLEQRLTQKWARIVVIQKEKEKKESVQFISSRV